jgi:hypothetical protein
VAVLALTDATVWIGGYDWTTDTNDVSLDVTCEELLATTFGSGGTKSRVAGLRDVEASVKGFWQSTPDAEAYGKLGTSNLPITIADAASEGSVAYFAQVAPVKYASFGSIGELTPFSLDAKGTGAHGVVRGQVALAKTTVTTTGAKGSAVQLGAVSAAQWLYAVVHCFTAGTTVTVKVQSDDNAGFTTPTDRITLSAITTVGGTWVTRLAGPVADTYYRFNVSAVTGSFSLAGAIGIG